MDKLIGIANKIRNVVPITIIVIALGSCKALYSQQPHKTGTTGMQDSLLVDRDGNRYPVKKMLDNNLWMIANLKLNIPDSYCYENVKENCDQYGRLYTWESAQKGCSLLGEGWRLPTDDEWLQLASHYGFSPDSIDHRKKAYKALLYDGSAQFKAILGGGRGADGKYARLEAHGFYWTATEKNSSTARFYNFGKGSQSLYRQDEGEKLQAISVRCVNKMDKAK
jgi:uncharacterized protein (TIGR02145 family)